MNTETITFFSRSDISVIVITSGSIRLFSQGELSLNDMQCRPNKKENKQKEKRNHFNEIHKITLI